jgi:hypothetical protein
LGLFEGQADIGKVSHPGAATFDAGSRGFTSTGDGKRFWLINDGFFTVTGGGANIWFTNDAFHFVWTRASGDLALRAAIGWMASGGNAHRKACLMVRQSLAPDSAYVDLASHGNGLVSLQYREATGAATHEIQVRQATALPPSGGTDRMGIERQGGTFFATLGGQVSGAYMRMELAEPLYVGLAVCAHDDAVTEQARFSDVELRHLDAALAGKPVLHCSLETVDIASGDRRVVYHTTDHIEAPNWSRDGRYFLFNADGRICRLLVAGGAVERLDTGFAIHCNNDHGLSPDGVLLAISDQTRGNKSLIYVLPSAGGEPRQITTQASSYWHGWSPDGATLAFCGERGGEFDVYTIPAAGGEEKRLTTAKGLDDGPDFTSDGKYIYFNSERTGMMQIWRMAPDGSQQEQVTSDNFNNWFAHPSPDGQWLVFLSYENGVTGHPANQTVRLRLMPLQGGPIRELARLFGGQGTINVSSWSPDSRQVAFVSYELLQQ